MGPALGPTAVEDEKRRRERMRGLAKLTAEERQVGYEAAIAYATSRRAASAQHVISAPTIPPIPTTPYLPPTPPLTPPSIPLSPSAYSSFSALSIDPTPSPSPFRPPAGPLPALPRPRPPPKLFVRDSQGGKQVQFVPSESSEEGESVEGSVKEPFAERPTTEGRKRRKQIVLWVGVILVLVGIGVGVFLGTRKNGGDLGGSARSAGGRLTVMVTSVRMTTSLVLSSGVAGGDGGSQMGGRGTTAGGMGTTLYPLSRFNTLLSPSPSLPTIASASPIPSIASSISTPTSQPSPSPNNAPPSPPPDPTSVFVTLSPDPVIITSVRTVVFVPSPSPTPDPAPAPAPAPAPTPAPVPLPALHWCVYGGYQGWYGVVSATTTQISGACPTTKPLVYYYGWHGWGWY